MQTMVASTVDSYAHVSARPIVVEQAGAICFRKVPDTDRYEVLLITGRSSGQLGIPKGHVHAGETTYAAAAREAFEEAGVIGAPLEIPVGSYTYSKSSNPFTYRVQVHLVETLSTACDYPEKGAREIRWVSTSSAGLAVNRSELRRLLIQVFG